MRYTPVGCLSLTAIEANDVQGFIRAGAAAPFHIRTTFRTVPSDWSVRLHWVWRMQISLLHSDKRRWDKQQEHEPKPYYQYYQSGVEQYSSITYVCISPYVITMITASGMMRQCTCARNHCRVLEYETISFNVIFY